MQEESEILRAVLADSKLGVKFRRLRIIGKGAQGTVFRAEHVDGRDSAIKLVPRVELAGSGREQEQNRKLLLRELENHSRLVHPAIVQYKDAFVSDSFLVVVMEYADAPVFDDRPIRSLLDLLHQQRHGLADENLARHFFQQLIVAVDYCHRLEVTNRDIKLEHCLLAKHAVSSTPLLKVCDWGLSKSTHANSSFALSLVGTPGYWDPQVVLAHHESANYDPCKADVYSCGVLLYKLLFGVEAWPRGDASREHELYRENPHALYEFILQRLDQTNINMRAGERAVSSEVIDLLKGMLHGEVSSRFTIQDVINCPWFQTDLPEEARDLNDKLTSVEERRRIVLPSHEELKKLVDKAAGIAPL